MDVLGTPRPGIRFAFVGSPKIPEKSPLRNAKVGTVSLKLSSEDSLKRSRLKKKKVFLFPFVRNGIGPPIVPPKSLRRFLGRTLPVPFVFTVNGLPALNHSFTRYS